MNIYDWLLVLAIIAVAAWIVSYYVRRRKAATKSPESPSNDTTALTGVVYPPDDHR